jgi:carboxymethylenebutenolidase
MRTDTLSFDTGGGETTAYAAIPDSGSKRAVLVIQEYWGVNENIKDIANRLASEGFIAIVPDLYRGKTAKDSGEASQLMGALKTDDGIDTINNAIASASSTFGATHFGIIGFCMGGTFALRSACLLEGISAAAPFYGDIPEEDVLKKLTVPTIFVSATEDKWINPKKVATLEDAAERYELPVTVLKYEADHAFFNNTRPEVYNEAASRDAWALVMALFNEKL